MITTIGHMTTIVFLVMRTFKIYTQQLSFI